MDRQAYFTYHKVILGDFVHIAPTAPTPMDSVHLQRQSWFDASLV